VLSSPKFIRLAASAARPQPAPVQWDTGHLETSSVNATVLIADIPDDDVYPLKSVGRFVQVTLFLRD